MSLVVEDRPDGSIAFSYNGDLQFDSRDEAIYHENLVLPALTIARKRGIFGLRVLICGGGDGLALREVLRFPGVESVDLVDLSEDILELGRTRFGGLNGHAFEDSRVTVTIDDAWAFLARSGTYDVIIADFSVPRIASESRVFTKEWYAMANSALSEHGVLAINAVSPQMTPAAFWSQVRTVRAAGFRAVPFHSCIPSFRDRGYGAWGVILASREPLRASSLRELRCPVPTRQSDPNRLWRSARFSRAERMLARLVPVHSVDRLCLVDLLMNRQLEAPDPQPWQHLPAPLRALFESIPVSHPYHTRLMVQTLATNIVGDLSRIRLSNLLDELLKRAKRLPQQIVDELHSLRESFGQWASWQNWNAKILAALILVLTVANTLSPDHAFAKGAASFGHASMGRTGSFSRSGSFGSSGPIASTSVSGGGFRSSSLGGMVNGRPAVVDMEGNLHTTHIFYYSNYGYGNSYYGGYGYGYGYGGHGTARGGNEPMITPTPHTPIFAADDDMLVMDNGDLVITVTPIAYLIVTDGHLSLMGSAKAPLISVALDPGLGDAMKKELDARLKNVESEAALRKDWLSWVNWTAAFLPSTAGDKQELTNLTTLQAQLTRARKKIPKSDASDFATPSDSTLLFIGCYLFNSKIQFRLPNGTMANWDSKTLTAEDGKVLGPTPPELVDVIKAVLVKLSTDLRADLRANASDKYDLAQNESSLRQDEQTYQNDMNVYGMYDTVDYGTDQMSASQAYNLTERDLTQNAADQAANVAEFNQLNSDIQRVDSALRWFK